MEILRYVGLDPDNQLVTKIVYSVLIILVLILVKWLSTWLLLKHIKDPKSRFNTRKSVTYATVFLGIILVGRVWFEGMSSITTFLGLVGAGLAIALRDIFANLAGWLFIIWRKPFETGNRIQIGEHSGDVIDIRPFEFTILEINNWVQADQSTGRMIHIPNGMILNNPLSNYDSGFRYIWNEIPVLITFESDWKKAKGILEEIASRFSLETTEKAEREIIETSRKFFIYYRTLTPKVYTSVENSGVLLTIRYLTMIRQRRGSAEHMWESILERFAEHPDINLAYPTTRFYSQN
ncbi:MAG: mechanosensitive ion channel [Candidatus Syntrophosphaera sp.]